MRVSGKGVVFIVVVAGMLLSAGCQKSESPAAESKPAAAVDQHPPFGFLDSPKENEAVAGGMWAYGWALDDSGIASVQVSIDDGAPMPAATGQFFPGVKEAYPKYPDPDKAGFGFNVPKIAAGPHLLAITLTAKDGGKTEIKRHFQIK